MNAREDIAYLVGSESRLSILRELSVAGARPTDLAERCSCARETAQRTLAGFGERGWVEKRDRRYHLTAAGELVLNHYEGLEDRVETAERLGVFLAHAGDLGRDLPPSLYGDLTVSKASAENPHAPVERLLSVFGEQPVGRLYGVSPIVSGVFNRAAEGVIGPETTVELVIDQGVLDTSRESYPAALELTFDLTQMRLYLSPESLTSGLLVADDRAIAAAYDDDGNVAASVDGDDRAFVKWVTDRFVERRERAELLRPPIGSPGDPVFGRRTRSE